MLADLYGLISISFPNAPLARRVWKDFSHWEVTKETPAEARQTVTNSIELRPFEKGSLPVEIFENLKTPYAKNLKKYGDRFFVLNPPGTSPCVVLEMKHSIVVHYPEIPSWENKLRDGIWDAIHLAALRVGGMLVKGAVVARDNTCLAIVGPSASGKTSLLLGFLYSGWDYLGNDKFLLHSGKAHLLESSFICHGYHLAEFPWLFKKRATPPMWKKILGKSGLLQRKAVRLLPEAFLNRHRSRQMLDPFINIETNALNIHPVQRKAAEITHWLLLGQSDTMQLHRLPLRQARSLVAQINSITYNDISRIRLEAAFQGADLEYRDIVLLPNLMHGKAFSATISPKEQGILLHQKLFEQLRDITGLSCEIHRKPAPLSASLVVPTYNRPRDLDNCLRSILMQTVAPLEVLVVDDGNLEELPLREEFQRQGIDLVYLKKDVPGLTESRNLGAVKARGEIVFYLDDDVVLFPNYVEEILKVYEPSPDIDAGQRSVQAVGGIIANPKPMTPARALRYIYDVLVCNRGLSEGRMLPSGFCTDFNTSLFPLHETSEVDFLDGGVSSFRRSLFNEMGFTNRYREYGLGEDKDFSRAVARRGRVMVTPHAKLYHYESPAMRPDKRVWGRKFVLGRYLFFRDHVKRGWKNDLCFWYALSGYGLARIIIAIASMKKNEFARLVGIAEAVAAIASGSMKNALREEDAP